MRINLTKKDLVNSIYMRLGFTKNVSELLIEDFFNIITNYIKVDNKIKISKFGTFILKKKNSRIGRNPKTKEEKTISARKVILFKPSKEFKEFINNQDEV